MVVIPQIGKSDRTGMADFPRHCDGVMFVRILACTVGPQGWTAPFVGLGAYLSAITPLVGVAMIVTLVMMQFSRQSVGRWRRQYRSQLPFTRLSEPILRGSWTVPECSCCLSRLSPPFRKKSCFAGSCTDTCARGLGTKLGYLIGSVMLAAADQQFYLRGHSPSRTVRNTDPDDGLAIVFAHRFANGAAAIVPSIVAHRARQHRNDQILIPAC